MSPHRARALLLVASTWLASSALGFGASPVRAQALETEEQKTVYALGLAVAQNLRAFDLTPAEVKVLAAGLTAGLSGEKPAVELGAYREKLDALAKARSGARLEKERAASSAFLASAADAKGAVKQPSGLIYQPVAVGSGASPTSKDKVKVHYTGKLRDGRVFDSSVARGEPAEFPLARMIPCWLEGLQLMKPGGKAVLSCPAELAYGDTGVPPNSGDLIPPGAALQFEVELLGVEKDAGEAAPEAKPAPN